jgi:AAA+ ATPase superfamily predicted ATPase
MTVSTFSWPLVKSFVNRSDEQDLLAAWWDDRRPEPLAMIGCRRVGKSWLFRKFAHGKPAVILVAEELPANSQLSRFADALEPLLGFRPDLPDAPALIRVLFRMARDQKVLAVIDEFPWILGGTAAEAHRTLTAIQAAMEEERDQSNLKLILCGSQVSQMELLFSEKNPMHGRLQRFVVRPLMFSDAKMFLPSLDPVSAFERFAVSGGMPLYLSRLSSGSLREATTAAVLNRDAALFNEGRVIVEQELREPRVYFAVLEQLAGGAKAANEIAALMHTETQALTRYLAHLEGLRLISRLAPLGADPTARTGRWRLEDEFLRFWFRFVFPFQTDLESGLVPRALFDAEIAPVITDHVSPVFEDWCLHWLRANGIAGATRFGKWWGNATNEFRRSGERFTEEIDGVGTLQNRVVVVAEAKWSNKQLTPSSVADLENYKIPALRQSNLQVVEQPEIVLFAKSGYSPSLRRLAERQPHITLVDVPAALGSSAVT